ADDPDVIVSRDLFLDPPDLSLFNYGAFYSSDGQTTTETRGNITSIEEVCVPNSSCEDIDNDTLCDEFDDCLDTAPGAVIDDFGCEIPPECADDDLDCQLEVACPCDNDWASHGPYVVCVGEFERDHRGEPGIGDVVSEAGCSDCGGSHVGHGCDDDGDGVVDSDDLCLDTPRNTDVDADGCPLDYSRCFTLEGQVTSVGTLTNSTGVFLAAGIRIGTWVTYEICTDEDRNGGYFGGPAPASWISQSQYYW
ncbi:unnamed protein product, partial [marine sediment metagenome]